MRSVSIALLLSRRHFASSFRDSLVSLGNRHERMKPRPGASHWFETEKEERWGEGEKGP